MSSNRMPMQPGTRDSRHKVIFTAGSCLLHGAFLFAGGILLSSPAEFGVQSGLGGGEVDLIAAPKAADPAETPQIDTATQPPVRPVKDEWALPKPVTKPSAPLQMPHHAGDGSSPVPGTDATTAHASSGARAAQKPGYLRNPAPRYPKQARLNGWTGTVVLRVTVSPQGRAARIKTEKSSGSAILDESALKAVQKWTFSPACYAGVPVESETLVPIRFSLDD